MPRVDLLNAVNIGALLQGWFLPQVPGNTPRYVLVCDIGQGNLNAIFNEDGQVFLYYDMGGGWLGNKFTYPVPEPGLCTAFAGGPRFVLSGWDGDHVTTINRIMPAVGNTDWLAPTHEAVAPPFVNIQTISPASQAIRTNIINNANLHLWPDSSTAPMGHIASVTTGLFTVLKSNGTDGNNAGLVLRIQKPGGGAVEYMLLTGDAAFQANALPLATHGCDNLAICLVASHHGAPVHVEADVPRCNPDLHSLLAISCGNGNSYTHPVSDGHLANGMAVIGIESYTRRGWEYDISTSQTAGTDETAFWAGPRGNVGFIWSNAAAGPGRVSGPGTPLEIDTAAIALLASAAAEIQYYEGALGIAVGAANAGAVAAAVAFQCARELSLRADPVPPVPLPPFHPPAPYPPYAVAPPVPPMPPATTVAVPNAARIAQAMLVPETGVALAVTAAVPGAPEAVLASAIGACVAAATYAAGGPVDALAREIVTATFTAAARARANISSAAAQVGLAGYNNANIAGPDARRDARTVANSAALVVAVQTAITAPIHAALHVAANNVQAALLPTHIQLRTLVGAVIPAACQAVIAMGGGQRAQQPPSVARAAFGAMNVLGLNGVVQDRILLGVCAAAALAPGIPINPQTPDVPVPNPPHEGASRTARAAVMGVMAGLNAGAAANADLVAVAVAAARTTMPAAQGAPQSSCHRHPRQCGAGVTCALSVHCFPQEAEILGITHVVPAVFAVTPVASALDVFGAHFVETSSVHWAGGAALPVNPPNLTAFVSGGQMQVQLPPGHLNAPGVFTVEVRKPGGQVSNLVNVTVAHAPVILGIVGAVYFGVGDAHLTVNGNHFQNGAFFVWNGVNLATVFVNANQVTVVVPALQIPGMAGVMAVTVLNPDTLNSAPFNVNVAAAPAPTLLNLSHPVVTAGAPGFVLSLGGTNFFPNAQVQVNGGPPSLAAFISNAQLNFTVPTAALAVVQTYVLEVQNPDGQTTASNMQFIVEPTAFLGNLNPSNVMAGSPAIVMQVNGAGFVNRGLGARSVVLWNGMPLMTAYVNAGQLTAAVPAGHLAVAGTANVTVRNPALSVSNVLVFTIHAPPPQQGIKRSFDQI